MSLAVLNMDEVVLRGNVVGSFLEQFESDHTKRGYEFAIKNFFKVDDVARITVEMMKGVGVVNVQNYIKKLVEKGLCSNTIKNRISALGSLYEYVKDLGGVKSNPFKSTRIKKMMQVSLDKDEELFKGKILEEDEIGSVLEKAKKNRRDYLMLKMMLNLGLRRSEVGAIKWKDFEMINGEWYVRVKGKGRKSRILWLNEELVELLKESGFEMGKSDWPVFGIGGDMVGKVVKKYAGVNAHSLRHTAITYALMNSGDREAVQNYAGHSSGSTTDRYIHFVKGLERNAARFVKF
jgi:integrase